MWVCSRKHGLEAISNELAIPVRFQEATVCSVDFFDGADVADVNAARAGANNRACLGQAFGQQFILNQKTGSDVERTTNHIFRVADECRLGPGR